MLRQATLGFLMSTLVAATPAGAQPAPPPAAPGAAPARAVRRPARAPADSRVTVTRKKGCVTVQVCPGATVRPMPAPPAPPPPPAVPRANQAPPPPPGHQPACAPTLPPVMPKKAKPKPYLDPARTRLGVSNTAEILGHGDWEFVGKELGGLLELNVGLFGRLQIGIKTSPVTWFIEDIREKGGLWAAEIRWQFLRSRLFKMTADLTYFHIGGIHGLLPSIKMKIGGDQIAFHAGLGAAVFFIKPMMAYDAAPRTTCAGTDDYDCGGSEPDPEAYGMVTANLGFEARFWKYGKFWLDAFVAAGRDAGEGLLLVAAVPGVRFHGRGFAADIGCGVLLAGGAKLPFPVLNLSYRW